MGTETPELRGLSPQHFQKKLTNLISESRAFALAEDLDSISILLSDWLPSIRRLLADALTTLGDLEHIADQATGGQNTLRQSWSKTTGTLILPRAFEELSDLCFIATAECRACQKQLAPLSSQSEPFTLLVVMERAQSRLSSSLCAVENRLARMCGCDSKTRHVNLARKSLRARNLIARFRRRMTSVAQETGDMEKRIRSIGSCFAWLLGHDHFSSVRASDRLAAKMLHQKTLDWLRSSDSTDKDGERLWHDVVGYVEMLRLINRRPEVMQHDFKIVLEAISGLVDSDPHGPLPCSVVALLNSILGRDELLDEMLTTDADAARGLARLLEIRAMLEREGAGQEAPDFTPPSGGPGGPKHDKKPQAVARPWSREPATTVPRPRPMESRARAIA